MFVSERMGLKFKRVWIAVAEAKLTYNIASWSGVAWRNKRNLTYGKLHRVSHRNIVCLKDKIWDPNGGGEGEEGSSSGGPGSVKIGNFCCKL